MTSIGGPSAPRQGECAVGSHKGIPGNAHEGRAVDVMLELKAVAEDRNRLLRCQCENKGKLNDTSQREWRVNIDMDSGLFTTSIVRTVSSKTKGRPLVA